ncbi:uncharacterized protein LOC123557733 isoform X3 [Mercenaria mercenaria]|uniref:uncharacterized protein LOC123557733 isoform X3 n=1 Tax=Mercenaria mercenaria TaxID=6596 RepID=UPI00234F3334|nr:uncharacterized protein LOC123557733 isoform X3 [Mercenaria mercenaria]
MKINIHSRGILTEETGEDNQHGLRNGQRPKTTYLDDADSEPESTYLLKEKETEVGNKYDRKSKQVTKLRKLVVLISCLIQLIICNGIGFGLSVMYAELIVVFNAKRSDAALVQSVYMGIATGGGIIFSGMIRKVGPGISIVIGSVVCCIGLLASSFATGLVTIIMCTGVISGNAESWFIVDLMVSRGFSRQSGSVLVSAIGIASLIGRLMGGVLRLKCTKWPTLWHWLYLCPITAATHVLVVNFFNIWSIMGACIAYGISFGAIAAQAPAVMFEASGLDRYPQGMAMVNLMYGFGNVFSGLLGGYIRDTVGDYDIAFYIAAGTSLYIGIASAVAAFFFWRRNQRASDEKRYSEYTRLT